MKALIKNLKLCQNAARSLRRSSVESRDQVLRRLADLLEEEAEAVLRANAADLKKLPKKTSSAFRDRLLLNRERIAHMAESLRQVAALPDPLAEPENRRQLPNGLKLRRVRAPLGVLLMIFESRPNVATEAFSLAFKAGNIIILRGGKESMKTTGEIYRLVKESLSASGFDPFCLWGIVNPDRKITEFLLQQRQYIDVVVPRGGEGLIDFVVRKSLIPIIKNDRGLCHLYIDEEADPDMAVSVAVNAKTQRPGVCNAVETLLVHETVADELIPRIYQAMAKVVATGVSWFGCKKTVNILRGLPDVKAARKESWDKEYLDYMINCRVVDGLEEALFHIEEHGSRHSESIITENPERARLFQESVDAAVVYWNASTRFTDGFEFGLGGELGISTQKLHVRGPVGLRELTCLRWVVDGEGQIRG